MPDSAICKTLELGLFNLQVSCTSLGAEKPTIICLGQSTTEISMCKEIMFCIVPEVELQGGLCQTPSQYKDVQPGMKRTLVSSTVETSSTLHML